MLNNRLNLLLVSPLSLISMRVSIEGSYRYTSVIYVNWLSLFAVLEAGQLSAVVLLVLALTDASLTSYCRWNRVYMRSIRFSVTSTVSILVPLTSP